MFSYWQEYLIVHGNEVGRGLRAECGEEFLLRDGRVPRRNVGDECSGRKSGTMPVAISSAVRRPETDPAFQQASLATAGRLL